MEDRKSRTRKGKRPPARLRYEQSHPVVSCRLSRDEYDLLKQRLDDLGGVSFANFLKDALGVIKVDVGDVKQIKEVAHKAGYEQGRRDHQIWYICVVCGKRIYMSPRGDDHKEMVGYMREHGWRHGECR